MPDYPAFDAFPDAPPPLLPRPAPPPRAENPPWNGWDVLAIAFLTVFAIFVSLSVTTFAARHLFFSHLTMMEVGTNPLVSVVAQVSAYLVVIAFMVALVERGRGQPFWKAIRWNWPTPWLGYLLGGVMLSITLEGLARLLPMPKEVPMDRFFQTPAEAWALSLFGVTIAPFFEELFFRGFLYPVLARRLGVEASIFLTALGFSLVHAPQLAHAWGPVLIIFLVGLVLTMVRAVTKSVARGLLIHMAYNATIGVLLFVGSDGFRHLEKLNQ